jgi:hypothetical protein
MRTLLLKRPNPLSFPGVNPGFDPSHPAAQGITPVHGFSGVATGGAFTAVLIPSAIGSLGGTPVFAMDGLIGPSVDYSAPNSETTFTGFASVADANQTVAVIARFGTVGVSSQFAFSSFVGGGGGISLTVNRATVGNLGIRIGGSGGHTDIDSGIGGLSDNTPYLLIASATCGATSATINFLIKNLLTGSL